MRGEMEARRRSRAEWRRRWRSVPYPDHKRVRDALRWGRKVGLAGYRRAMGAVEALLGLAALAIGIADDDTVQVAFGVVLLALAVAKIGVRRIERGRLRRAAEANRALAGLPRYPDEET